MKGGKIYIASTTRQLNDDFSHFQFSGFFSSTKNEGRRGEIELHESEKATH